VNTTIQHHLDGRRLEAWPADDDEVLGFWKRALIARADAGNASSSPENRLLRAYDAARIAALAIIRAAGYRTRGAESHHFITFDVARSVVRDAGLRNALATMNSLRKVRHEIEYEAEGELDESTVAQAVAVAEQVISEGAQHLRAQRPNLGLRH
jgi:hypothetical protein